MERPGAAQQQIRLWRDAALGVQGMELLRGACVEHAFKPHVHEEYVVAVFSRGAQVNQVGRHRNLALPGSVLLIPPGEPHLGHAADAGGWSYRAFYPDSATLQALARELAPRRAGATLAFAGAPLRRDRRLALALGALHARIEAAAAAPLERQQAFAAAMELLVAHCTGAAAAPPRAHPPAVRRAIDCMRAQRADPALDVHRLASAACLSPFHFMRVFRATVGVTAHAYLVQLRLDAARRLLAAGERAARVAAQTGFADQSHLIRHFRAAYGVTPGRYARDCRR